MLYGDSDRLAEAEELYRADPRAAARPPRRRGPVHAGRDEQSRAGAEERGQAPRGRAAGGRDARRPPPGARKRRRRDDDRGQQPGDPLPPDGQAGQGRSALPRRLRDQPPPARRRASRYRGHDDQPRQALHRAGEVRRRGGDPRPRPRPRRAKSSRRAITAPASPSGSMGTRCSGLGRFAEAEKNLLEAREHPRAGARRRLRQPHPRDGVAGEALRADRERDARPPSGGRELPAEN